MRNLLPAAAIALAFCQGAQADETIYDLYAAIGDTVFFPLVDRPDGKTITNAAGRRLKTQISEEGRFLAYLEEGGGWAVNTFKFWPLADGGALAATMVGSFEGEVMFADSYAEFYRRRPGGKWEVIDPPVPALDISHFVRETPDVSGDRQRQLLARADWGLFYELRPDSEQMVVRPTATNREKCWPEIIFGLLEEGEGENAGRTGFCRDVDAVLTGGIALRLDAETGRFELVEP